MTTDRIQIDTALFDANTERPSFGDESGPLQFNEVRRCRTDALESHISAESKELMTQPVANKLKSSGSRMYIKPAARGRTRAWKLDYRFNGRRKTLSLGPVAKVDARAATEQAGELLAILAQGTDPSAHRKATKRSEGRKECFESVARRWLDVSAARRSAETQAKILRRLENDVFPTVGGKAIDEIDAPMLLQALRTVEKRDAMETTHRIQGDLVAVFDFAIAEGLTDINPAARLKKALRPPVPCNFAAITDPTLLAQLLLAMDGYDGSFATRVALRLLPMLAVRPGQLRRAEWQHMDLENACWQMPGVLRKASQEAKRKKAGPWIPLPRQAVEILRELHALTGHGRYLFPNERSKDRPMSANTINTALRTLGYAKEEITGHGFRASLQTICENELFIDKNLIEVQLQHTVPGPLADIYNRSDYREFRAVAMQTWADYLDALRQGHGKEFIERVRRVFGPQRIEIDNHQVLDQLRATKFDLATRSEPTAANAPVKSRAHPPSSAQWSFTWAPQSWAVAPYRMKA